MTYDLKLLSKYRTELMGVAMIWVLLYHSKISLTSLPAIHFIKSIGYGGVDIFLLLSGMSIFCSTQKGSSSIYLFYKRRFTRIIPSLVSVTLLMYLVNSTYKETPTIMDMLLHTSTLSFWLYSDLTIWYIAAILVLYLISPIFIFSFKYYKLGLIIFASLVLSWLVFDTSYSYLLLFTARIPIYFVGIYCGYLISTNKILVTKHILCLAISFMVGCSLLIYFFIFYSDKLGTHGLFWYPFMLISLPLAMLIARFFSYTNLKKHNLFYFLGSYSLLIYLFNEKVLVVCLDLNTYFSNLTINLIAIILTLISAYVWHYILDWLMRNNLLTNLFKHKFFD